MYLTQAYKTLWPFFRQNNKPFFQPKPASPAGRLTINQPNDPDNYRDEQEADAMAEKVMRMKAPLFSHQRGEETFFKPRDNSLFFGEPVPALRGGWGEAVQRKCAHCEEEEKKAQLKEGSSNENVAAAQIERYINSLSGGTPLPERERSFFEPHMGYDFSDVKIHTDSNAAKSAQSINALAYTTGNNIVFSSNQYKPNSDEGRRLLAHELTHVVQQQSGIQSKKIQRFSTEDCSDDQVRQITEAKQRADAMLANAINRLTADPVTTETQRLFANHFGKYAEWRRDVVVDIHYKKMQQILTASEMTFECESECDEGEPAYTYWVFGDVHLCPPYFSKVLNEKAETMIHELFHLQGSFDLGYHKNNADADTWWSAAVNNADSFSELAQDLYEQP